MPRMLMRCARCQWVVEAQPGARCRSCNGELTRVPPDDPRRDESSPTEVMEHTPTKKRPSGPIRHD
jgi:hypothetical protein